MEQLTERTLKLRKLAGVLQAGGLDAVLLTQRPNFAWITGGGDNHIANSSQQGVATILASADELLCLCNTIESPRFRDEELAGRDIRVIDYPWYDAESARKIVADVIGARRVAADSDPWGLQLPDLPSGFTQLRWQLTPQEVERYREGGRRTSQAIESACRMLKPGMNEHDIAAVLDEQVHRQGLNPVVTLVAVDERIARFRHPIPTSTRLQRHAMLVTCAEFGGLISNVTRLVHFGAMPADLRDRHQAVCDVDAAYMAATVPGRTLGEVFAVAQQAYADAGYPGQWQLHHQGGSTGYAGREVFAVPGSRVVVLENQAFAWNPSITGTKSEDTVLATSAGVELLTFPGNDWPTLTGTCGAQQHRRADVLVM